MAPDTVVRPKVRILHCADCRTIEELPDFDGPPDRDIILEVALSRHETNGHRHIGKLYDVEERVWALPNLRKQLIEQIKGGGSLGLAAIDPEFYNVRDTFKEDAAICYGLHQRPKEGCSDWKADSKRLLPPTKADRKELGLSMEGAPKRYLCDFCPCRAYYDRKQRGE
jgi:hypothetical protein